MFIKGKTMGTYYQVKIYDPIFSKDKYKKEIDEILVEVNRQMSTYIEDSEISLFNKYRERDPYKISKEFFEVLKVSKIIFAESKGEFDPTVYPLVNLWGFGPEKNKKNIPTKEELNNTLKFIGFDKITLHDDVKISKKNPLVTLDLSAIAKGFGIDLLVRYLKIKHHHFLVEIGGEVYASGFRDPYEKENWKIGIEKPSSNSRIVNEVIILKDQCIATSGDYRNFFKNKNKVYSHAIDLKTGKPKENNIVSVSVLADNCTRADGLATAILVSGKANLFKEKAFIIKKSDLK